MNKPTLTTDHFSNNFYLLVRFTKNLPFLQKQKCHLFTELQKKKKKKKYSSK